MRKNNQKRKKTICENLDDDAKEKSDIAAKKRMEKIREKKNESRDKAFDEVKNRSMIDPSILELKAFDKIMQEEYLLRIRKGPD